MIFTVAMKATSEIARIKTALRKQTRAILNTISRADIEARSNAVVEQLMCLPAWKNSTSLSCYISMPTGEVDTKPLLYGVLNEHEQETHAERKALYVPKITGKNSPDMVMLQVKSTSEMEEFPENRWGIPESPADGPDATYDGVIDLVVVPGVLFDASCHRVGHGKGYYDCFLERINKSNIDKSLPPPITVGVCFDEQVSEEPVPLEPHDLPLDFVVTPTRVFASSSSSSSSSI